MVPAAAQRFHNYAAERVELHLALASKGITLGPREACAGAHVSLPESSPAGNAQPNDHVFTEQGLAQTAGYASCKETHSHSYTERMVWKTTFYVRSAWRRRPPRPIIWSRLNWSIRTERRFPHSLDGAPLLLPGGESNVRRAIDRWLATESLRPVIVGEFDDATLMKLFGQAGYGIFPAPSPVEREVREQFGAAVIGRIPGIRQRHYAFSTERNPRHPSVVAILQAARAALSY